MITHSDEGPDHDPEDPLTVLLRPSADYLGAPPGRYEAIRRGASRRRLVKAAAGAALTCGIAALAILPLRLSATDTPGSPAVPMAPPSVGDPSPRPSLSPTPRPSDPVAARETRRNERTGSPTTAPDAPPAATPSPRTRDRSQVPSASASVVPSAVRSATPAPSEPATRP
ncbi:hypothetical protein ABZT17_20915 [Streptomyces sp. NPDC005648]|uniref:hypothetical protein n=1 Tax=Streptomyces sp. NPDC005648 TaxID=3157044 RepID=UPI00339DB62A